MFFTLLMVLFEWGRSNSGWTFYYTLYYLIICANETNGDIQTTFSVFGQGAGQQTRGWGQEVGPGGSGVGRERHYFLTMFMKTYGRRNLFQMVLCLLCVQCCCVQPHPHASYPQPAGRKITHVVWLCLSPALFSPTSFTLSGWWMLPTLFSPVAL